MGSGRPHRFFWVTPTFVVLGAVAGVESRAAMTASIRDRLSRLRELSKHMRADGARASSHLRAAARSLRAQTRVKRAERLP